MRVYFVGAGPGDVELITVKGKKLLEKADVVVYAGSLVNRELLRFCKEDVEIYDSSRMHLDEIIKTMVEASKKGKKVVRLHTGDPTIYGAIREQIDRLHRENIQCEIVPGVSSFTAAAAALEKEFTLPDVSQTVILTRIEGRAPVPEKERLHKLAQHRASMAIFLSVHKIEEVVEELKKGYSEDTPVVVVQKASWKEEVVVPGSLKDISKKVKEKNITKTAIILVGDFLGNKYSFSKLYNKNFSHGFREALK